MPGLRRRPDPEAGRVSLLFDQNPSRRLPALLAAEFPWSEQVATPKVIWLRVENGPTWDVGALLRVRAADIQTFLSNPTAGVLELP